MYDVTCAAPVRSDVFRDAPLLNKGSVDRERLSCHSKCWTLTISTPNGEHSINHH